MRQLIVKQNQRVGLARMLATSGYPSTLDGGKHYIEEGAFACLGINIILQARRGNYNVSIDEVGSIYTCQGFVYAGIIIRFIFIRIPKPASWPLTSVNILTLKRLNGGQTYQSREIKRLKLTMVRNHQRDLKTRRDEHYVYADPRLQRYINGLGGRKELDQCINQIR